MGKTKDLGGAEIPKSPAPSKRSPNYRGSQKQVPHAKVALVVMYTLTGAGTTEEISQETKLSASTVKRIQKAIPQEVLENFGPTDNSEIADLITQQIKENLLATQRIAKVTEDEVWLKAQRAPELGTFYAIITDKTIRILDSIERANERERMASYQQRARLADVTEDISRSFIKQGAA